MRIVLTVLIFFLGVNLGIDLLNSNMRELIEERNATIQKLRDQ